jgi:hypothetical protein
MPQTTEGAGPAIAAHSKDASTLGQNPASEATGDATSLHEARNTAERSFQQVVEFVRTQPPFQWRCSSLLAWSRRRCWAADRSPRFVQFSACREGV